MKKILSLLLIFLLCCMPLASYASESSARSQLKYSKGERPNGIDEDPYETKGSHAPTTEHSLPYTASATINSYVFTNYYFYPSYDGWLSTCFSGYTTNISGSHNTCKVTIKLFKVGRLTAVDSHTYSAGSNWSNCYLDWGDLDPDSEYYFKISKTNSLWNSLHFDLICDI